MVTGQSAMIKYWVTPITLQPNFNNSHKICTYCPFYVVPYIRINKGQRWLNKHGHFLIKICLLSAKKVCILSLWLGDARPKVEDVGCSVPALHQIDKFFLIFLGTTGTFVSTFWGSFDFFSLRCGWRFAPQSWVRLDYRPVDTSQTLECLLNIALCGYPIHTIKAFKNLQQ